MSTYIVLLVLLQSLSTLALYSSKDGHLQFVEGKDLLHSFDASSHPLLQTLKNYHVFVPHHFEDVAHARRRRDLGTELHNVTGVHLMDTYFAFEFENNKYILDLSINQELLPRSFSTSSYTETGKLQMHKPTNKERNHCYYQGTVRGVDGSRVIMSTCNGLRGCIILPNDFLIIEPLVNDASQIIEDGHVIYRTEDVIKNKATGSCGNKDAHDDVQSFINQVREHKGPDGINLSRHKRDLAGERMFVELLIVADNAEAKRYPSRIDLDARIKELVNFVDGFYRELGIRIVLSHIEVWNKTDKIELKTNAQEVLNQFLAYRLTRQASDPKTSAWVYADNVHLLYGGEFDGSTIGMASVNSMCGQRSGGVNQDHASNVIHTAATVAHEMGHNFGMLHDTADCSCTGAANLECIMAASSGFSTVKGWSSCSESYLQQNLKLGISSCLLNVPDPMRLYGGPFCGNDIVEQGEECDCGFPLQCQSNCCNATTCQLLPNAVCDSGVCCSGCNYITAGTECRGTSNNMCDLAEYCTGYSANCPPNVYTEDGTTCIERKASCFDGVCLTHDLQCQGIWGESSSSGADQCYTQVNALGTSNGNCGKDSSGDFIACSFDNAKCGKLQCQGGNARPLVGRDRTAFKNTLRIGEETYVCKTISSDESANDVSDPGLVRSGTMCAQSKICIEGECMSTTNSTCSSKCNGNGICNNLQNCHCDAGWAPPYCNLKGNGGSVNSGPVNNDHTDVQMILMIVMLVVVLPIVLIVGTFVWYRYCGGSAQIQKWKKNREERLDAVARMKRTGGNKHATNGKSNSEENLFDPPAVGYKQRAPYVPPPPEAWDNGASVDSGWSKPPPSFPKPVSAHTPNKRPPPRPITNPVKPPAPAPAPPSSIVKPSAYKKPENAPAKPAYTPPRPAVVKDIPPAPMRSAPPPPKKATNGEKIKPKLPPNLPQKPYHGSNPVLSSKPQLPSRPAPTPRPQSGGQFTTNSEPASPDNLSVMERARKFNAI